MAADAGHFGTWRTDEFGLPSFDVEIDESHGPLVLPESDVRRIWHQVGNDRVTATAHVGGWTTVYFCDRGLLRVGDLDPDSKQSLGGMWRFQRGDRSIDPASPELELKARWGMGYAQWDGQCKGFRIRRRVWAPFGDLPAICAEVEVESERAGHYEERWGLVLYPLLLGLLVSRWTAPPPSYAGGKRVLWYGMFAASALMRGLTEVSRRAWGRGVRIRFSVAQDGRLAIAQTEYHGFFRPASPSVAAYCDGFPKPLFLCVLEGEAVAAAEDFSPALTARMPIEPGVCARVRVAFGCASEREMRVALDPLRLGTLAESEERWRRQASFKLPQAPWLERELTWHAYYLRSAQVHDDYFETEFVPQGSAYTYVHGAQGAIRDYALTCVPLTFLHPAGARAMLRLMMRMTTPNGMMYYAHTGFGRCTSVFVHRAPTDLPLFFLWALTEYLWATGDVEFLHEWNPFYPKRCGEGSTVLERVCLAWRYVRDRVGRGEQGMLRVGSGDWSDPLSLMVRNRFAFRRRGESAFNTAMAVFVLPRVADLLDEHEPGLANEIRALVTALYQAMERAWTGRWFLRGWDGQGRPLGAQHLFLDSNVWALVARVGTEEQRGRLVDEIRRLLDDPSPIGARILDRPHPVRAATLVPGWDCNGGVWAALNGLLTWAYALHDPELAWRSLQKQSLAAHARAYPHIWYGIWSGPDAYNAHDADLPGQTFVHPATPMTEFPIMNSNAHAMPLLAVLRLAGVETCAGGIRIEPRLTRHGPWKLDTPLLTLEFDGKRIAATTRAVDGVGGRAPLLLP